MDFKPQFYPDPGYTLPENEIREEALTFENAGRKFHSIKMTHTPTDENVIMSTTETGQFDCEEDRKMLLRALAYRVHLKRGRK